MWVMHDWVLRDMVSMSAVDAARHDSIICRSGGKGGIRMRSTLHIWQSGGWNGSLELLFEYEPICRTDGIAVILVTRVVGGR